MLTRICNRFAVFWLPVGVFLRSCVGLVFHASSRTSIGGQVWVPSRGALPEPNIRLSPSACSSAVGRTGGGAVSRPSFLPPPLPQMPSVYGTGPEHNCLSRTPPPHLFPPFSLLVCESPFVFPVFCTYCPPHPTPAPSCHLKGGKYIY